MQDTTREIDIVSPVSEPSNEYNKKTSNKLVIAILLASLLLVVTAAAFVYLNNSLTKKSVTTSNDLSHNPASTSIPINNYPPFDSDTTSILYSVNENGFNQIVAFKDKSVVKNYSFVPVYYDEKNLALYSGSQKKIFVYDLKTKIQKEIYQISDPNLVITRFSQSGDSLYITLSSSDDDYRGYIDELNLISKKLRRIGPEKNVVYGSLKYFFKTTSNDDVLGSFGGDGCGGFGEIRLKSKIATKSIAETGGGCNEQPEEIAVLPPQDQIVLLSKIPGTYENPQQKFDSLYKKNIYTGEEKVLLDFKGISKDIKSLYFDKSINKLYLIFLDEIWTINIQNEQIENKTPINKSINLSTESYYMFHNNKLYSYTEDPIAGMFNVVVKSADIVTGEKKQYNWGNAYPISGSASIIGFWQDEPLIMLYVY